MFCLPKEEEEPHCQIVSLSHRPYNFASRARKASHVLYSCLKLVGNFTTDQMPQTSALCFDYRVMGISENGILRSRGASCSDAQGCILLLEFYLLACDAEHAQSLGRVSTLRRDAGGDSGVLVLVDSFRAHCNLRIIREHRIRGVSTTKGLEPPKRNGLLLRPEEVSKKKT